MEVICLEEAAFYSLVEEVVERLKEKGEAKKENKWIGADEAMQMLRVKSPTTLRDIRDKGKIRYSQPQKKIILYDRHSIEEYLEENSRETF